MGLKKYCLKIFIRIVYLVIIVEFFFQMRRFQIILLRFLTINSAVFDIIAPKFR